MNRSHQRGAIALLLTALLGCVLCTVMLAFATTRGGTAVRDHRTIQALTAAREVLIARAVKGRRDQYTNADEPLFRPGSLPCPDIDNDGSADGSNCSNYVGRLPFKTLETDDLRDGAGERLWYVLSPNFRPAVYPTSNSVAQLHLTGDDRRDNVVALLIAPGGVVDNQARACDARTSAKNTCDAWRVENYLEGKNAHRIDSVSPNSVETEFETWPAGMRNNASFNDTVIAITWDMVMPLVESRIAREARRCLERLAHDEDPRLPWPSTLGGAPDVGARFGRYPMASAFAEDDKMCRGSFPYTYFNAWRPYIFYALSPAVIPTAKPGDTHSSLRINGQAQVDAVVMLPGRPLSELGQSADRRMSSPMDAREFLESHPHDPSAHNWQVSTFAPDDHYAIARPNLAGTRQFNDTVECLSNANTTPCTK